MCVTHGIAKLFKVTKYEYSSRTILRKPVEMMFSAQTILTCREKTGMTQLV